MKGISRIDSGSTHGWFVRGYRNKNIYSKLFSDRKCGGKGKALDLAKAHRDELNLDLKTIPKEVSGPRFVTSDTRNKTGVIGVCRTKKSGPNGNVYECYTVTWRPSPGVQKCTSFSIRKYGEKFAFKKAVEFRRARMCEIHGADVYRRLARLKKVRGHA